ncbi:hypothetical protein Rsub_06255 [Raphidocelis subcapitata]|uniref:Macro domain-containing protein n=1 Tax=Raphidocelis subcapitata TaxID=307507 RepID=A0A2V0P8X5_9CHLO|nr:hypothetical protein Rsub_06255 [Raphidocelis subcapitata]|eukprot:GBF93535.1 hypothetical protein Rsub_06255 [Raphidocelis subcapitata]
MRLLVHREGDLLGATETHVVHQANCITQGARGVAAALFARFPWSDVYARRARGSGARDAPGSIAVRGDGGARRWVVAVFGQVGPGKPRSKGQDTAARRLEYFEQGLRALARLEGAESFAFPHLVGCGLAGGEWRDYEAALERFAGDVAPRPVVIYRLGGGGGGGGGGNAGEVGGAGGASGAKRAGDEGAEAPAPAPAGKRARADE